MPVPDVNRIVVVGGGISGLAAAIFFARQGRRVTLVEQHALLGGYLQSFHRDGVRFEVGFHQLGASLPGEVFARYFKVLGVYDDLVFLPYRDEALFRIALSTGRRVAIPRGAERIAAEMKRQFPLEAAGIDRVLAAIGACVEASPWLGLRRDAVNLDVYQRAMDIPVRDVVESHVASPELREAFYAFNFNTTLPLARCPFGIYAFTFHVLTTSCARIRGGGAALTAVLEKRFRSLGGTVLLGRSAERLEADGKFARALVLSDGTRLEFDVLISTCHPQETVRFCGRDRFSPVFLENLDGLEQTRGSFKLYLEMDGPVDALEKSSWFVMEPAPPWQPGLYVVSPSSIDPTYDGRHTLEILHWQDFREVEAWKDSAFGRRPRAYEAFKERTASAAIGRIEREFPGIRGRIRRQYASTPLTNLHYTRSVRGATMGVSQDIQHQGMHHLRPRNRLRNVFLGGQSLGTPGIVGCVINSAVLCDSILPEMDLRRQLKEVTF